MDYYMGKLQKKRLFNRAWVKDLVKEVICVYIVTGKLKRPDFSCTQTEKENRHVVLERFQITMSDFYF